MKMKSVQMDQSGHFQYFTHTHIYIYYIITYLYDECLQTNLLEKKVNSSTSKIVIFLITIIVMLCYYD